MEKSRAIELLEHLAWDRDIDRNPYGDALNIAIDALKAQLFSEGTTPERETVKCIIGESCMDIGDADFSIKCAKCGAEYYHVEDYDYDYNFCPNCGRRWRRQDG